MDSYALLALVPAFADPVTSVPKLNCLVRDWELSFPDAVLKDCKENCEDTGLLVWLDTVDSLRYDQGRLDQIYTEEVLEICEDLWDIDDLSEDQAPVRSAAMGLQFADIHGPSSVVMVTDDEREHPVRMNLRDACSLLGIKTMNSSEFMMQLV